CIPYNEHSLAQTKEFAWIERLVSYPIWATPKDVNPKNISQQLQKLLDKAIEKNISYESIHDLIDSVQYIASLFNFTFDASRYTAQATQGALNARIVKQEAAQYHFQEYTRLQQELEAS
ncbi:MAG: hypothetical protein IM536_21080, partial [Pseudanabaena sp. M34BS1SP1A06MG]|nr:hypothetical protein [Pseudanabaena sp. M34BS1SP1A06MG]